MLDALHTELDLFEILYRDMSLKIVFLGLFAIFVKEYFHPFGKASDRNSRVQESRFGRGSVFLKKGFLKIRQKDDRNISPIPII